VAQTTARDRSQASFQCRDRRGVAPQIEPRAYASSLARAACSLPGAGSRAEVVRQIVWLDLTPSGGAIGEAVLTRECDT
jgi:hypothetical protein